MGKPKERARPAVANGRRKAVWFAVSVRLQAIAFNHDPRSALSDALTIRESESSVITAPEWSDGTPSKPAAYVRATLTRPITIKASFGGGPRLTTVPIRAVTYRLGVGRTLGAVLDFVFGSPYILSTVLTRDVQFGPEGQSGEVTFQIDGSDNPPPVGIYNVRWTWQRYHKRRWIDFSTSQHLIYVLPDHPHLPWSQEIAEPPGHQLPLVAALEKACYWASGATTVDESTAMIARALNEHPRHIYDPDLGTGFVDADQTKAFNLSLYLFMLDRFVLEGPQGFTIDCRGTATALMTFANLLGASLYPLAFQNSDTSDITTKEIRPFTTSGWTTDTWVYHEVAAEPGTLTDSTGGAIPIVPGVLWPMGLGSEQLIYDAVAKLKQDNGTAEGVPILPVRMPFGVVGTGGYRHLLINVVDGDRVKPFDRRPVY